MTFEEATEQMLLAIDARDMDSLALALTMRGTAIKAGFMPRGETIEAGHRALLALVAFRKSLVLESARLRQLQNGMANALMMRHRPHVDYQA